MEIDSNVSKCAHLEVWKKDDSDISDEELKELVLDTVAVFNKLESGPLSESLLAGGTDGNGRLVKHVRSITVDIVPDCAECPLWQVHGNLFVHVFHMREEGSYDETTEDDPTATVFTHWELPAKQFDGLWESLAFEDEVKPLLLEFSSSSLLFSAKGVNPSVISWNHVVLLHGPPGTGKTSLCCALAQKLAIRLNDTFQNTQLLEINSHSLFSKWFSESGKLVSKLFSYINELAEDEKTLVCILIDEVESLAAARTASLSGSEPSDSIRVVNALLTQIDRLKGKKNVLILTTSNITEAIDLAFVDRADIRHYIGLPPRVVRERIISSCIQELLRTGILVEHMPNDEKSVEESLELLQDCVMCTNGMSGRALRKLPFQTHARLARRCTKPYRVTAFLKGMCDTAQNEKQSIKSAGKENKDQANLQGDRPKRA